MPEQLAVGIDDGSGVVIKAGGALLEQGRDDHDAQLRGQRAKALRLTARGSLPRDRTGGRLPRGRNMGAEQFLEADDLRAHAGGLANLSHGAVQIGPRVQPPQDI